MYGLDQIDRSKVLLFRACSFPYWLYVYLSLSFHGSLFSFFLSPTINNAGFLFLWNTNQRFHRKKLGHKNSYAWMLLSPSYYRWPFIFCLSSSRLERCQDFLFYLFCFSSSSQMQLWRLIKISWFYGLF